MVDNSHKKRGVAKVWYISIDIQGLEQEHDLRDGRRAKRITSNHIYSAVIEQREYLRVEDEDA